MIDISKRIENSVMDVISGQSNLAGIEVIRLHDAVIHASFPRIAVGCSRIEPLIPGQAGPLRAELTVTVQTEAKADANHELCGEITDNAILPLLPPDGAANVNAADGGVHFYKFEINAVKTPEEVEDIVEAVMTVSLYVS